MHNHYPPRKTLRERINRELGQIGEILSSFCSFGMCQAPATRTVITPTAIGCRVERVCDAHAQRRHELEQVLDDQPISPMGEKLPALPSGWAVINVVPTVLEDLARCPACGQPQSSPDCAAREHWGVA